MLVLVAKIHRYFHALLAYPKQPAEDCSSDSEFLINTLLYHARTRFSSWEERDLIGNSATMIE